MAAAPLFNPKVELFAEGTIFDLAIRYTTPKMSPTKHTATVVIDDESLKALGQRWPMDRELWAEFFKRLSFYQPAAIAAGVVFDQPASDDVARTVEMLRLRFAASSLAQQSEGQAYIELLETASIESDHDITLVRAIAEAQTVVLGNLLVAQPGHKTERASSYLTSESIDDASLRVHGTNVIANIPPIESAVRSGGIVNLAVEHDGMMRRYNYLFGSRHGAHASLALAAMMVGQSSDEERERLLSRATNHERNAARLPAVEWTELSCVRFTDILREPLGSERLRGLFEGRIVFVGVTAAGVGESFSVLPQSTVSGVALHAAAAESLFGDANYVRTPRVAIFGLLETGILLGVLLLFGRRRFTAPWMLGNLGAVLAVHLLTSYWLLVVGCRLATVAPVMLGVITFALYDLGAWLYAVQRRQMRVEEERRIIEAKTEFLSVVSHELRSPLTAIDASLRLVNSDLKQELSRRSVLLMDVAASSSQRMIRLVNDVLDLHKLNDGKMPFQFEDVDLVDVVSTSVEVMQPYANESGVSLTLEHDDMRMPIRADYDRLIQVMTNLLSNAVKYSPQGAIVRTHVEAGETSYRINVSDRGRGIAPEHHAMIFKEFAQVPGDHAAGKDGTGLGLPIAKAIVLEHKGHVGLQSRPGDGSTFYFELPRNHTPATRMKDPSKAGAPYTRILNSSQP